MAADTGSPAASYEGDKSDFEDDIEDENTWKEIYTSPWSEISDQSGKRQETAGCSACDDKTTVPMGPKRMELNDHKAGMEKLDKEKINKIIFEASKGSKFYENELKKEARVTERIARQTSQLMRATEEQKQEALKQADLIIKELEATRDLERTIVHVDMDAFYAAVEIRENPSLRHKPMAVGGTGMLSTSNYEARKYGVRAAMPGFIGKKLCPSLIIVPPHFDKYKEVSYQVREVLAEYDPNFVSVSLDEAYLDLTEFLKERGKGPSKRVFALRQRDVLEKSSSSVSGAEPGDSESRTVEFGNDVEDVVREMRFKIEQKTQLTASAGIAPNAMLAKVCSDRNKPNGQFYLKPDRENVLDFVRNLPIRKISGIGRVSEQMLKALGIENCADLYAKRDLLYLLHSQISCRFLLKVCLGLGDTRLEGSGPRKSLGTETTFSEINRPQELYRVCENLSQDVVKSLKSEGLQAKTVTIKLKTVAFDMKVRSHSFPTHVSTLEEIFSAAKDLLCHEIKACQPKPLRLRLMGVRLSNFQECDSSVHNRESRQHTITNFLSRKNPAIKHSTSTTCDRNLVAFADGTSPCYSSAGGACVEEETPYTFAAHQDCSKVSDDPSCCGLGNDLLQSNLNPTPSTDNQHVVGGTRSPQQIDPSVAGQMNTTLICPICGNAQTSSKAEYLEDFNKHVDLCLSKSAIKEMLSKDREHSGQRNPLDERDGAPQVGSRKRRKSEPRGSSKKMTLHEFWAK